MKKDLVSILDLDNQESLDLIDLAKKIKAKPGDYSTALAGKSGVLIFEKPSLRTRVTFEIGMSSMGGYSVYLAPADVAVGIRETVEDVARSLSRWVHVIIARTFSHKMVVDLAANATISVINALSDYEHPCQALADYMTVSEKFGDVKSPKVVYIGDGNNVCISMLYLAATIGANLTVCTPSGYEPPKDAFLAARERGQKSGAKLLVTNDLDKAVAGADVVYTDVWTSMGQEDSASTRRFNFENYRISGELMAKSGKKTTLFMHCLPAHRHEEVTPGVLEGPNSIVFDQAENRLHIQKAILYRLLVGRS